MKDANGGIVCAPAGTPAQNCVTPPVCDCKGQNGCREPCFGVTCSGGLVCTNYGPKAGQCVPDNCLNVPCPGCGKTCNDSGVCVDNPCTADACPPDQACKPSADFSKAECVPSCANAMCAGDEVCKGGACVKTCSPACAADQVCDESQQPPTCVPSKCAADSCPAGGCCDPLTGQCGACPCEGVVCPASQVCTNGDCFQGGAGGGTSSSSSSSGAGGSGGEPATTGAGASSPDDTGVFGLPTGGGGFTCTASSGTALGSRSLDAAYGLVVLALGAMVRRRKRSGMAGSEVAR